MAIEAPIGTSDFPQLREEGSYYVDKTAFITQLLQSKTRVLLLPRPRRFGKTLNMSMLRTFLERSPIDRAPLFEGLQVWDSENARRHFQRHPVIYLTFKDVKYNTWSDTFAVIRELLGIEVDRHRSAIGNSRKLQRVADQEASDIEYPGVLRDLSAALTAHYGEQTVILLDEYDAPIQAAYVGGFYGEAVKFFRNFFSGGFKDNPNLF